MAQRWDFFISYTTADQGWAEWIAWQLEETNYRVLVQAWDFVPGSHWSSRMGEGIEHAERTVAVLSHAYLKSVYGQHEWEAAFRADPRGFARKLIPVRIEDCPRPALLDGVVSFDLFGHQPDAARDHLLHNITIAMAGRAKPAVAPAFPVSPPVSPPGVIPPTQSSRPPMPEFPDAAPASSAPTTFSDSHISAAPAPLHTDPDRRSSLEPALIPPTPGPSSTIDSDESPASSLFVARLSPQSPNSSDEAAEAVPTRPPRQSINSPVRRRVVSLLVAAILAGTSVSLIVPIIMSGDHSSDTQPPASITHYPTIDSPSPSVQQATQIATTPPPNELPEVTILNNSPILGLAQSAEPIVRLEGFAVRGTRNYGGNVVFAHTTILYEERDEAHAMTLAVALKRHDDNIYTKLNDGNRIPPDGSLILVLTKYFRA